MNTTGNISYNIAVIRGGNKKCTQSLKEGQYILKSLTLIGYNPIDVVIDRDGLWTTKGLPTDAHYIFTIADSIVDTTHDDNSSWRELANKMWVPLLLSHGDTVTLDREDIYKIFRQKGIPAPKTFVVRSKTETPKEVWRNLWQTFHTPLLIRPLKKNENKESILIRKYSELENALADYRLNNLDVHIFTYKPTRTLSIAILPNFRGKKFYTPLAVETFSPLTSLPRKEHPMRAVFQAGQEENEAIRHAAIDAYKALDIKGHASIDMIPYKNGYMVVNVDIKPSLSKEGRFIQSLATTGIDMGQYIHSIVSNDF